jgi:hypothetical protein
MRLKTDLYDVLLDAVDNGIDDDAKFDSAVRDAAKIIKHIISYVQEHGNIALTCGGEWMYQSDRGQVDALELVSDMLESLSDYAEQEDNNREW